MLPGEAYANDLKLPKIRPTCTIQFWGAFIYDCKGPCYIFDKETKQQKEEVKKMLDIENQENKTIRKKLVPIARRALREIKESVINSKAWAYTKKHKLKRGWASGGC